MNKLAKYSRLYVLVLMKNDEYESLKIQNKVYFYIRQKIIEYETKFP